VENGEANDGCLEEKKDGIELVVAFVARNPGGRVQKKCGIPLSSESAKSTGVKQEKRMKKARWLA
jgi:hypothetical protein